MDWIETFQKSFIKTLNKDINKIQKEIDLLDWNTITEDEFNEMKTVLKVTTVIKTLEKTKDKLIELAKKDFNEEWILKPEHKPEDVWKELGKQYIKDLEEVIKDY